MGLYDDPMDLFGRLSMEMMRAVRLVVDTGIHAKGWQVQEAVEYMMSNTGAISTPFQPHSDPISTPFQPHFNPISTPFRPILTGIPDELEGMHRNECEAECYRYEAWPGQAVAYKVGEVAIWAMRRGAEQRLASRFDLPSFHSVLLEGGPMPLEALQAKVEAWVQSRMRGSRVLQEHQGAGAPAFWAEGQQWNPRR
jgi:uncharacterized protein (DUF885 family)